MKINLLYFSQTGNTRRVAEAMAGVFRQAGHTARPISLKKATPEETADCDVLGVGAPCFSSQAPTPIKVFLGTLPSLERKPAFVFATSGGAPGRVLYDLTSLLRKKGAAVVGGFLARGELHHPAPCLKGRFPHRPNTEDLAGAQHFAEAVLVHVLEGKSGVLPESRPDALHPTAGFYAMVARVSTDSFLRFVLPEPRLIAARCTQCRWCALECPVHNITMQPYPRLGIGCIRCYRCLSGCPQEAFTADWRLGNLAILLFYNTAFEHWFGDVRRGERVY